MVLTPKLAAKQDVPLLKALKLFPISLRVRGKVLRMPTRPLLLSDLFPTTPFLYSGHSDLLAKVQGSHLRTSVLTVPSVWNTLTQKERSTFKAMLKIPFSVNLSLTTRFKIPMTPCSSSPFPPPSIYFLHRTCHFSTYYKINLPI